MKLFEERHNKYKETLKNFMSNKLANEREKYEKSYKKNLNNKKLEQKLKKEKAIKKYEGYVSNNRI